MFSSLTSEAHLVLKNLYGLENIDLHWEAPKEAEHGDVSTAVALRLAKQLGKSPREIAENIAHSLSASTVVEKCEVAGAGYVNIWMKANVLLETLFETEESCTPKKKMSEPPVIIDYSSPNIAKPLGIHHILSTVIGQTLVNLYQHNGNEVVRWNYLGDWGTQFGKLAVAFEKWGKKKPIVEYTLDELLSLYVKFHDEAEKDDSLEEEGQAAFRRLEQGDQELRAFWSDAVAVTKQAMSSIYQRLHVSFDVDRGESYYEDKMLPILEEGKKKSVFKEGEKGALIVEFPEEANMPPAVVVKGDGATLYLTRDLALMKDRMEGWHPKAILWAVDIAQQLYFKQLFATVNQLGWNPPTLEHVYFGRMRFADGAMSTRKGKVLKLEEVLDEAVARASQIIEERGDAIQTDDPADLAEMMGVGALVYGILSQNRKMDMVFDWDKMLSFEGNSAPYLQYTHARARSILRKAEAEGEKPQIAIEHLTPHERVLILTLLRFSDVLLAARTEHLPHKLANYLYELCQAFNAFYNVDSIVQAIEPARSVRLYLTRLTADVLRVGSSLLTIRVPDRM